MPPADDLQMFIADGAQRSGRIRPIWPGEPVRVEAAVADGDAAVEILSPRLRLRPLNESDRDQFCALLDRSREHLDRFLPLGTPEQTSAEIFARQLELTIEGDASRKAFRRIAVDRSDGSILGAFNLVVIRRGLELDADTSCWLGTGATGRGLAVEGLAALLSYSFADLPTGLGIHTVNGFIDPMNTASQALAAALGFERVPDNSVHLTVGDRWMLHDKWSLPISRWLRDHG